MASKDFFISYAHADENWAKWIAGTLEENGFSAIIQAWDFLPGNSFIQEMNTALTVSERIISVLSPHYLSSDFAMKEWYSAIASKKTVIPIKIASLDLIPLMKDVIYCELIGLSETEAVKKLLQAVGRCVVKRDKGSFPGCNKVTTSERKPPFPGKSDFATIRTPSRDDFYFINQRPVSYFEKYEADERSIARKYAAKAMSKGIVTRAERIYSDIHKSRRLAYYRQGVPLLPLLFLYEQVVVYIPPCSQEEIKKRFEVSWDVLIKLIKSNLIIPIIGHPPYYVDQPYLKELFDYKPASVWARGDELALEFANGREYWKHADMLTTPAHYFSDFTIIEKFKRQFPELTNTELAKRIDNEVKTNYVDLCIFGYENLATSLLMEDCRKWGARAIIDFSEKIVYPSLIGLGGTPNYALNKATYSLPQSIKITPEKAIGPELSILTDGLSLTIDERFTPDIAIQFHKDAMSKALWNALEALENAVAEKGVSKDDLINRAHAATEIVTKTVRELNGAYYQIMKSKTYRTTGEITDFLFKVVSIIPLLSSFEKMLERESAIKAAGFIEKAFAKKTPAIANQLWKLNEWSKNQ